MVKFTVIYQVVTLLLVYTSGSSVGSVHALERKVPGSNLTLPGFFSLYLTTSY